MSLFDKIQELFDSETVSAYNNIVQTHREAFRRWRGQQKAGTLSIYFDTKPKYNDKVYVVNHRSEIIAFEKVIAEEKAFAERRSKVITAASNYPHAFVALIQKLPIKSIQGINATLPGDRMSKRAQRLAKERPPRVVNSIGRIYQSTYRSTLNPLTSPRRIDTLPKDEYEKIYLHISELPAEETRIKKELEKEDIKIKFEDEVLDNNKRSKYYQDYCNERLGTNATKEAIMSLCAKDTLALHGLDQFITITIAEKIKDLKKRYPGGCEIFPQKHHFTSGADVEDLLQEYIENEEEIAKYEENYKEADRDAEWEKQQASFSKECRSLRDTLLSGYGCYKYAIPFQKKTYEGNYVNGKFEVWQMFIESYCSEEGLDYSYYPSALSNYQDLEKLKSDDLKYKDSVYDKIATYIESLKEKHPNLAVVEADSNMGTDVDFFNYGHFEHLRKELTSKGIVIYCPLYSGFDCHCDYNYRLSPTDNISEIETECDYLVVVELISTNDRLKKICGQLVTNLRGTMPKIVYISLSKGYSRSEMVEIIDREKKKKEEAERAKREEEERQERERQERIREEQRKQQLLVDLRACVQDWDILGMGLRYSYLLNYYPTTCDFEANDREWEDRWTVWNFKNTPGKTSELEHHNALNNVLRKVHSKLVNTFGIDKLSELTLVCIPASSQEKTRLRYEAFAKALCDDLSMANAYDHITVTGEQVAKHLGGSSNSFEGVQFDEAFFKDRYVILFDDIITKGHSMLLFKRKMEQLGATVIAAMAIGKTKHERV